MLAQWWIKYQRMWEFGADVAWTWRPIGPVRLSEEALESGIIRSVNEKHNWRAEYLGIEYEQIPLDEVPDEVILLRLRHAQGVSEYYRKEMLDFGAELLKRRLPAGEEEADQAQAQG